mmetsp:Transcript_16556/g.24773  ORF Transcript_16556/g.24773 Transcript_16556/m.24773 type:complete len:339 (-) Transcript_16556:213-1229(-)
MLIVCLHLFLLYGLSPIFALTTSKNSLKMPKPRPGVEAAVRLSNNILNASTWTAIEHQYKDMLLQKNGMKLFNLDEQCDALAKKWHAYADTPGAHCTCDDLYTVIEWKFAKGKARPMLWKHIRSNDEENVKDASRRAFQALDNVQVDIDDSTSTCNTSSDELNKVLKRALETFSELKGIGPATSSAFLSLYRPDLFAFMDDEVLESFNGERKYTIPAYLKMNDECMARAKELGKGWTTRRIGKTFWSAARISLDDDRLDLTLNSGEIDGKESFSEAKDLESATNKDARMPKQSRNNTSRPNTSAAKKRGLEEDKVEETVSGTSENSIASRMATRKRRI